MKTLSAAVERLGSIAAQDTAMIEEINAAMERMFQLGLTGVHVANLFAGDMKPVEHVIFSVDGVAVESFHGFESRRQAVLAMYGAMPKKNWPATLQAAHERVETMLRKTTEAPTGIGTAILIVPSVLARFVDGLEPVILKRLPDGSRDDESGDAPEVIIGNNKVSSAK